MNLFEHFPFYFGDFLSHLFSFFRTTAIDFFQSKLSLVLNC